MNETHLSYLASPEWAARLRADLVPWIERVALLGNDVVEIGPGPGQTTDILRERAERVTVVELDTALAERLRSRLANTNVEVVEGDARALPFEDDRFSAATAFSMFHHVPSAELQDDVLAEIFRVLAPGAALFAVDARDLDSIRAAHLDDTFVPLPVETLEQRLKSVGYQMDSLENAEHEIRFVARKPGG